MPSNDEKLSKNYINHLIEILRNMQPQQAGWVLRELGLDISFDRELFNILCTSFYSPKYLKTEVSDEDLELIIKKLPKEIVAYLYENFIDYRTLIKNIYNDKKILLFKNKSIDVNFVVLNLISVVIDLHEKRQISYNGLLLFFFIAKCNPPIVGRSKGKIYFLKRIYIPGELIWFFISSPKYAGRRLKVTYEYSDFKTRSSLEINLDFLGEYWGWMPVEHVQGTTIVTAEVNSEIIVQDRIQIGKESPSLLSIEDFLLYKEEDFYLGSGLLLHKSKKILDGTKIRYSVYCDICSSPIYFNFCEVIENRINLKIEVPKSAEHIYERFRIFIWMEMDSLFFITSPINKNLDYYCLQILENRNSGEKVTISGNFNYGQRYFLFISRYRSLHSEVINSFFGEWELDFWGEISKKASGIDHSIKQDEIKLFTELSKKFRVISIIYANFDGKIEFIPDGDENTSNLYISLFKYNNGWFQVGYYISRLNEGFQFYIDIDKYNEGEESKTVIYNNDKSINISVVSPRSTKKELPFPTLYLKYGESVEVKYQNKTKILSPKNEIYSFNKYIFSNVNKNEDIEILKEIEDRVWKSKELSPELLLFRIYLINKYSIDIQFKQIYFSNILSILQEFRDSENHYYNKSTKDRRIYSIIIEHIFMRLTEKIVDSDIQIIFSNYFKNIEWKEEKRQSKLENDLIINTYKYLQYDSGEIYLIQEEFTLYELLILLHSIHRKYKKDMFEIFIKRKEVYKKIDSNGLRKIFEFFGFVEPRKNKYTKVYLKELSIKQILEHLNDGFYPLRLRDYIQMYLFIEERIDEKSIFPSRLEHNFDKFISSISIKINKYNFKLGEFGTMFLDDSLKQHEIYIEFPSFLSILKNSELYEINNRIYIERNNYISIINFQAKSIGRGYIKILEVNSLGKYSEYKIGLIESVSL